VRERVEAVLADARVQRAFRFISGHEPQIEADQIRLTSIPAPPFGETERARAFSQELRNIGLDAASDEIGNVIAPYEGFGHNPVVIAAHLDTVFPASTALELRRMGRVLFLPGISDNGCGLVALLWSLRAAKESGLRFRRPVVAVGDVGEEGHGNLRGMRHLFHAPPWPERNCEFIAVDGAGVQRITHQALGSRRIRVRMMGPGGHSWADFGRPNPVQILATAIHYFAGTGARRRPGTSFNVGVIRGGISVNAIPTEAFMEVDLRSTNLLNLDDLDVQLKRAVSEAVRAAGVECKMEIMGERPSGVTATGSPLVQAALEITRRFGIEPHLDIGSTDANIPMSMGIPAIAIGAGGSSERVHTPEEWFDPQHRDVGLHRLIALVGVLAGLG
jgi:acetylornithine deacetylase/succinyl-diaminopimelate desuccinylase-like protein